MLTVTAFVAAVLALLHAKLAVDLIRLRRRYQVADGHGGHEDLSRAIRAYANHLEFVPVGLILIACLELNGAAWWVVALPALFFLTGRVLHLIGLQNPDKAFGSRLRGTSVTLAAVVVLAIGNLALLVWRFLVAG